jgi:MarR family transcriptional repressor of emrRAB
MHIEDIDVTPEDDAETLRIENIFGAVGLALVDKMQKAFDEASGLNPSEAAAIIQIGTNPGLSIEQLRRIVALSHSATVRLVDQLASGGLVTRVAGDADRRAKALRLTESGETLYRRCLASRRAVIHRAVGNLGPDEIQKLGMLVEKLLPALVDPGGDGDVVCRVCDEKVCVPERCPITHDQH